MTISTTPGMEISVTMVLRYGVARMTEDLQKLKRNMSDNTFDSQHDKEKAAAISADEQAIRAIDIINDLRAGMTKLELMEKYRISPKSLGSILTELATIDFVSAVKPHEPPRTLVYNEDSRDLMRLLPRHPLKMVLPILIYGGVYDSKKSKVMQKRGIVRDISERGIGTRGIKARVEELKTFVIPANDILDIAPIVFEARCRWMNPGEQEKNAVAGFEIVNISDTSLRDLRRLIHALDINGHYTEPPEDSTA